MTEEVLMIDPPPPLRIAGNRRTRAQENALGMNAKLAVPDIHCDVLDLAGKSDAGIVEQDVQPSVRRHQRIHHLGPVLFRCHVEVQIPRVMAFGPQGSGRALAQLIADVGQHHLRALAHEQMGRRAAEAHQLALDCRRRTGQQRYLAPQAHPVLHRFTC
jgi:hypothetical protein